MGAKGPYQTKQLTQLTEYLKRFEGQHVTAAEICEGLQKQGVSIGTATVYRNLERLVSQGVAAKYTVENTHSACFEYLGEGHRERHTPCVHCKCEACGTLIHLNCHILEDISEHVLSAHGFALNPTRTVFYGVCEACRTGAKTSAGCTACHHHE